MYSLLQEDDPKTQHVIVSFLLFDGRENEATFEMMNTEGCLPRMVELVKMSKEEENARLHRLLLRLLYEMSRVQRLSTEDLGMVDDEFVTDLFGIIEELSDDVDDPYHYPIIQVLVCTPASDARQPTDNLLARPQRTIHGSLHHQSTQPYIQPTPHQSCH